jgi:hypothetical protein
MKRLSETDVPSIGGVRVTAKRMKARRGKSAHYFWAAEKDSGVRIVHWRAARDNTFEIVNARQA